MKTKLLVTTLILAAQWSVAAEKKPAIPKVEAAAHGAPPIGRQTAIVRQPSVPSPIAHVQHSALAVLNGTDAARQKNSLMAVNGAGIKRKP